MASLAKYSVSIAGKNRNVRLLRINQKNIALMELDGKTVEVSFPSKLVFDEQALITVNGGNHKIMVSKNDRSMAFNVEVDGKQFFLQLKAQRKELHYKTSIVSHLQMPNRKSFVTKKLGAVASLMPGRIVLLKVKAGDKVETGDPLCVLEAMKMENEIISPRDGTVTQVEVEKGSIVGKGDVLIVIE